MNSFPVAWTWVYLCMCCIPSDARQTPSVSGMETTTMQRFICSHGSDHCRDLCPGYCHSRGHDSQQWYHCTVCLGLDHFRTVYRHLFPCGLQSRMSHPSPRLSNHSLVSAPDCEPLKRTGPCLHNWVLNCRVEHQLVGEQGWPSVQQEQWKQLD